MGSRLLTAGCLAALSAATLLAATPSSDTLFDGTTPVELTLTAPLTQLFAKGVHDESYSVRGSLTYRDPSSGSPVVLQDIRVSVRGHTSRDETECTFPKLRIKLSERNDAPPPFTGMPGFKIGTHCGEAPPDTLTPKFGRLANEESPLREALTYRILDAAGVPTLRSRPARITYIDEGQGKDPLVRNAMLLEDSDAARARLHLGSEIPLTAFGNVRARHATTDAVRIAFGEALVGNFDWCLRFSPDDLYRCDNSKPLWNLLAFERQGGDAALVALDFDLAGTVVGRHPWFSKVYNPNFLASHSQVDLEVMSQVQRTRSLFDRATLDAERQQLLSRKSAVLDAIASGDVDPQGREIARAYVSAFFNDLTDAAFYRPVVRSLNVRVYADSAATTQACGNDDAIPVGTPVNELAHVSDMTEVTVLDALWRWAPPHQCTTVRNRPIWISSKAVSRDYPSR